MDVYCVCMYICMYTMYRLRDGMEWNGLKGLDQDQIEREGGWEWVRWVWWV